MALISWSGRSIGRSGNAQSSTNCLEGQSNGIFFGEVVYEDGRTWKARERPYIYFRNFIHHQACFYHRSLFVKDGFDESLKFKPTTT